MIGNKDIRIIQELLFYEWDAIGVNSNKNLIDEYSDVAEDILKTDILELQSIMNVLNSYEERWNMPVVKAQRNIVAKKIYDYLKK